MNTEVFREKLLTLRNELNQTDSSSREAGDTVELDQTRMGRLSRMDALQAQAMSQETQRRRERLLLGVKRALLAIDRGDYGYCEDCGEAIAEARLSANPVVETCIRCAQRREGE